MSKKNNWHYNLDRIDSEGALINIIYGERSGGKSYQLKHKKAIIPYLNSIIKDGINKERFILLRRFAEELKEDGVKTYFKDVNVYDLTDGKYNIVVLYGKRFYLANYDEENGDVKRGDYIGYVVALSREQHVAGASYLDVKNIIFEEFISRSVYLAHEPDKLMNFFNTVDRKRGKVKVWLAGNSISKICPYFNDWELMEIIKKQKQGTIITKFLDTGTFTEDGFPIEVKLAIEYCEETGASGYTIGKHKDMLNKGSWQSDPQPRLSKNYKDYKVLYRIGFLFKEFKFMGELLQDENNIIWFIHAYNKEFKKGMIVISDEIRSDPYFQRNIYDVTIKSPRLHEILDTFRESNIFYSTDLVGTDFKQAIDFTIRK